MGHRGHRLKAIEGLTGVTMKILLLLSAFISVSALAEADVEPQVWADSGDVSAKPWFCHDLDCPKFKVIADKDGYEVRAYEGTVWATTHVEKSSFDEAIQAGFMRLFKYISGANDVRAKIPMTAPVLNDVKPGQGPFCHDSFNVSFYVPSDLWKQPPAPTSDDVYINCLPKYTAYVYSDGGYWDGNTCLKNAVKLQKKLKEDGIEVHDYWTYAGYDPPFRPFNRHNEIWLFSTNETLPEHFPGTVQVGKLSEASKFLESAAEKAREIETAHL